MRLDSIKRERRNLGRRSPAERVGLDTGSLVAGPSYGDMECAKDFVVSSAEKNTNTSDNLEKLLVQCFGIRWRRNLADFGRPGHGQKGSLIGFRVDDKNRTQVDFWAQTGVYALYDGPELVYVGRATKGDDSLGKRLAAHNRDPARADRWTAFSWFGFRRVNLDGNLQSTRLPGRHIGAEESAKVFEGLLIEFLSPRLNNRGGDLAHVPRYAQFRLDAT